MKVDRRGFLKFLGIGAAAPAVATLVPASAAAPVVALPELRVRKSAGVIPKVTVNPTHGHVVTGNLYTPHGGLMLDKSAGEERIPFCNFESIHDVRHNPPESPVRFIQSHRCNDAHGGFALSTQRELPVGYWDDGTTPLGGKLRSAKAHQWVIYWLVYQNNGSVLTVGQAAYDSQWAAEQALHTEKPVLCPGIESTRFGKRTAIMVKANATDLSQAVFIELPPEELYA